MSATGGEEEGRGRDGKWGGKTERWKRMGAKGEGKGWNREREKSRRKVVRRGGMGGKGGTR